MRGACKNQCPRILVFEVGEKPVQSSKGATRCFPSFYLTGFSWCMRIERSFVFYGERVAGELMASQIGRF